MSGEEARAGGGGGGVDAVHEFEEEGRVGSGEPGRRVVCG